MAGCCWALAVSPREPLLQAAGWLSVLPLAEPLPAPTNLLRLSSKMAPFPFVPLIVCWDKGPFQGRQRFSK